MSCQIIPTKGYYEVYIDGEFYCTADTRAEAESEIQEYKQSEVKCK